MRAQPTIKETPPIGVINQMDFAGISAMVIKYIDPENNRIPIKKKRLTEFLTFIEKSAYVFTNNNTIT